MLIGGYGGTAWISDEAAAIQKPVIPIVATGGAAKQIGGKLGASLPYVLADDRVRPAELTAAALDVIARRIEQRDDSASSGFSPRYRFETFVVGKPNELAHTAAMSVADNPNGSVNPLFIWGGPGTGKTHLLHAIGQRIQAQHPRLKCIYITTEAFSTELYTAVRSDRSSEFRERFRSADVLLLDDAHFLVGKELLQEEFFNLFNVLELAQKQMVFTASLPPKDIPTLEERVRVCLEGGIVVDILPADFEMRVAIVSQKAGARQIVLPNDVAMFIAERSHSNVREVEGMLNKVAAYASLKDVAIDLELAREALQDVLARQEREVAPSEIMRLVATRYGLRVSDLKARSNAHAITLPRQIAMYLIKQLTDLSYIEIGRLFSDKHHSSVIYSVRKIESQMREDSELARTVKEILTHVR